MSALNKKWTVEKVECDICNNKYSKANIEKHKKTCSFIKENKDMLINKYNEIGNVEKIAKEFGITRKTLSRKYKEWGVDIKSDDNGRFKRINSVNDDYFDLMNEERYWLIGLLASDGYIVNGSYIGLRQSGDEGYQLIKYVNKIIGNTNEIRTYKTNRKPSHELYFSSKKIGSILSDYGIVSNKTNSFKMPNIPKKYLKDFIRGYIEGDGCIGVYTNNNSNSTFLVVSFVGTKEFVKECKKLIPIDGKVRKACNSNVYEIRWNGKKAIELCEWLFETEWLYKSYKYYKYKEYIETHTPRYVKYNKIKKVVYEMITNNISPKQISIETGIPFQTIYKWKKEWAL